jgi:hypothetical protein
MKEKMKSPENEDDDDEEDTPIMPGSVQRFYVDSLTPLAPQKESTKKPRQEVTPGGPSFDLDFDTPPRTQERQQTEQDVGEQSVVCTGQAFNTNTL